jgi:hypothetical protein
VHETSLTAIGIGRDDRLNNLFVVELHEVFFVTVAIIIVVAIIVVAIIIVDAIIVDAIIQILMVVQVVV